MANISIRQISEAQARELSVIAARLGISREALLRQLVEALDFETVNRIVNPPDAKPSK
jgi:plasmid stability protein